MTDTPETDHLENNLGGAAEMSHPALWAFARTLERERNKLAKDRDEWKEVAEGRLLNAIKKIDAQAERIRYLEGATNHATGTPLSKAIKQRNRLAETLQYWRDISECDCSNLLPNGGCLRCDLNKVFNTTNQNE